MEEYNNKFLVDRLYIELGKYTNNTKKLTLEKPEISSANKKTFIANFKNICEKMNRKIDDVRAFFESELCTTVTLNSDGALVIIGVYKQQGIMKVLDGYIKKYVTCKECSSCDTEIIKENRLVFLKCKKCLSKKAFN